MPKEIRLSSGAQHKSRLHPYQAKTLPSTSTPTTSTHTRHLSVPAILPSTALPQAPKMDGIVSSPLQHTDSEMGMNPTFSMTSPGTERASTAWTEEDDQRLMILRSKNMNWINIAQNFQNKTGNACRKRHERLVEKRNAQGWDNVKLADLGSAYMACRQDMWEMVAARCGGEKWQIIEQKCMEKGFKTLASASRSTKRQNGSQGLGLIQQPHPHHNGGLEGSPDQYPDHDMSSNGHFRDSGYYGSGSVVSMDQKGMVGPSASYEYHFGSQPATDSSFFVTAAPHTVSHSRRASAAHSIGPYSVDQQSSRSNSHGPSMAPPVSTNPFASPQPYYPDPAAMSHMGPVGPHAYPTPGTRSIQAGQQVLPSISTGAFDAPMNSRLPSIIGTQG